MDNTFTVSLAWEFIRQRSSVANRDAGASLTAFPRWSVGTMCEKL
ncbi:MAG: hypothetical protein ACU83U_09095 [Gammaproteobacteria bacterium]